MFRLTAQPVAELQGRLSAEANETLRLLMMQHTFVELPSTVAERPWVQLAYSEIDSAAIGAVLGYEGLTDAKQAIGLPCPVPVTRTGEALIYSTLALRRHIENRFPELAARVLAAFPKDLAAEDFTAQGYLAAGVVYCTLWCEAHGHALDVLW